MEDRSPRSVAHAQEIRTLKLRLAAALRDADEMRAAMRRMQRTRSWRWTAPLRRIESSVRAGVTWRPRLPGRKARPQYPVPS